MTAEENNTVAQLRAQLESDRVEIQNRKQSIVSLQGKISEYEARINAEPASEQQLADLQRGYDQSQANYNDLLKRKTESQEATSLEEMQQGERFTMLDSPNLPAKPDFPNRLKFCATGLMVGLALGGVTVLGFGLADDRMHSEAQIRDLLPIAVICEIPQVSSPADERVERRKAIVGWAMTATVAVIILAGSAVSYIHG
jgi:uncharacterized protein involved in exopolysaccharide biosynthesis